jgi:hypothetical protein
MLASGSIEKKPGFTYAIGSPHKGIAQFYATVYVAMLVNLRSQDLDGA